MIANVFQESKMFQEKMFVHSKLYIEHPEDINCMTQTGILSSTGNFFAISRVVPLKKIIYSFTMQKIPQP